MSVQDACRPLRGVGSRVVFHPFTLDMLLVASSSLAVTSFLDFLLQGTTGQWMELEPHGT